MVMLALPHLAIFRVLVVEVLVVLVVLHQLPLKEELVEMVANFQRHLEIQQLLQVILQIPHLPRGVVV
jgi:hypothetical protein